MPKLLEQIKSDLKEALRSRDERRISTLRMLLSSLHNKEIERRGKGEKLSREDVLEVIKKEIKMRREAIEAFQSGNREDLVTKEKQELAILEGYLPEQLSEPEIKAIVKRAIGQVKAKGLGDLGRVMGIVIKEIKGQAEGAMVRKIVEEELKVGT